MGLKSFAILSCCGKTEQIGVFLELCVAVTKDNKLELPGPRTRNLIILATWFEWVHVRFHR
jgi:hypothetical protein